MKVFPYIDAVATGLNIRKNMDGRSVKELAEEMGVSECSVYNWLRGDKLPNIDNLVALAFLLKTPLDKLMCVRFE